MRYSHGKPIVFGARVIHQVNESAIKDLFERLHDGFVKFSSNYEIAFSENGCNIYDLCFAFSSNDAFEEDKSLIRKNKGGFWKCTYTIGWLFNLETVELLTTNGFTPAHIYVLEMTALFLARNKGAQSLDAWKAPNGTITGGLLGPKTFL